jgi:excisionase family DNA binding protein
LASLGRSALADGRKITTRLLLPGKTNPMPAVDDNPVMLTLTEVARLLGIGLRTLRRHIAAGRFPKPIQIGGTMRYSRKAVLSWIDTRSEEGNR